MKIDRLIGIVTLLLRHEKLTAPALAQRFEVSRRTINRDIEALCRAGIPIVTTQGANGGVAIMDGYQLDRSLLSEEDLHAVLAGLASLDSVAQSRKYQAVIEKFTAHSESLLIKNSLLIDLSSHYRETLAPKIELLQESIAARSRISFLYCGRRGEHSVTADPYLVVFQWGGWYLLGLEAVSQSFKLYKLNRLRGLTATGQRFDLREVPEEALDFDSYFADGFRAVVLFAPEVKYRVVDEYGPDSFEEGGDGRLRFSMPFTDRDYLLNWVLSFGDQAELLEPRPLRPLLRKKLLAAAKHYSE